MANPGIDQARLATAIAFDRATTGGVIDRLEAKGLVRREIVKTGSPSAAIAFGGSRRSDRERCAAYRQTRSDIDIEGPEPKGDDNTATAVVKGGAIG